MKQETPLQRIIAIIKQKGVEHAAKGNTDECWLCAELQTEAEDLVPYERAVIEKAYTEGMQFIPVDPIKYDEDAKEYFKNTFES